MEKLTEALTGKTTAGVKSLTAAKLDKLLTLTGVFLALFMVMHMLLVSSILISKDFMNTVARFFEMGWIFGQPQPVIVMFIAFGISLVFLVHSLLAIRKFPGTYHQFLRVSEHVKMMKHPDTSMWYWQVVTGFIMWFTATVHVYIMFANPESIGPMASSDRVWSGNMWPLYLVLLFAVEIHGAVGLYRAAMKWGWLDGDDARANRKKLKTFKQIYSAIFITLGLLTLATFIYIGIQNVENGTVGQRWTEHLPVEPVN